MKWIKYLILTLMISLSLPVERLEQRSGVEIGYPIGEGMKAPVEQPVKDVDEEELHCMTLALLKESGGESERGSILVSQVIMNRTASKKFGHSVCGVVKKKIAGNCMFSFWCSPNREKVKDIKQYKRLTHIAYNAILGKYKGITRAKYFKVCSVKSEFFDKLKYLGREQNHCFFTEY